MDKPLEIFVGIPTGGTVHYKTANFLFKEIETLRKKYSIQVVFALTRFAHNSGHHQVFEYGFRSGCDFFIIIQSDLSLPEGAIEKLIDTNVDVVVPPVVMADNLSNGYRLCWNAQRTINEARFDRGHGLEKIGHASSACICVRKNVIEKFNEAGDSPVRLAIYDGTQPHEPDQIFFAKVKALGFNIYCNWDIIGAVHHHVTNLCPEVLDKWEEETKGE